MLWEFEDSGTVFTSTEANPEFTFHLIGGHTVSLTAYNDAGSMTEIKLDYIRVSLPVSDGDSGDLSSGTTPPTAEPTAVQTIRPDVTPVVTSVPTEPTQVVTPTETTAPVTPVPPNHDRHTRSHNHSRLRDHCGSPRMCSSTGGHPPVMLCSSPPLSWGGEPVMNKRE
ncbi:PKD domain-containing protein [Methanogenium cariaci]|uniref:PKD domain-containing protein n=1 Tax=Methanogenium cariaci TaxID=2197 RepID=UPI000781B137|nr:PKD domain-containing protein [Methanogenium cariaci]